MTGDLAASTARLGELHAEIDALGDKRSRLRQRLAISHDSALVDQVRALDELISSRWEGLREERARIRFGERSAIIRKARIERAMRHAA